MRKNKNTNQSKKVVLSVVKPTVTVASTNTPGYNTVKATTPVAKRKELVVTYKPTLILTDNFLAKVNYLHNNVQTGIEWSAILLYSNLKGSVDTAHNWVISVDDLILMDIGTSGYTEYDMSADDSTNEIWMDHLEKGGKMGHLHTHHNMGCFFSGTDTQELHDNAPNHNYYLSLIVNYKAMSNWIAKVAICGTEVTEGTLNTTKTWVGSKGLMTKKEKETLNSTQEMLYLMECTLESESNTHVPAGLQSRIDSIKAAKIKATPTTYTPGSYSYKGYGQGATTGKWPQNEKPKVHEGTSKPYSAGLVHTGGGKYATLGSTKTPYTSPGYTLEDFNEDKNDEWTGLYYSNGKPIPSIKTASISVTNRYSPKVCSPLLAKILDLDYKTTKTVETCLV
jgi:hypothetical protein